jgi:hypothetical protein
MGKLAALQERFFLFPHSKILDLPGVRRHVGVAMMMRKALVRKGLRGPGW